MTGTLITYEDCSMSLSCRGEMKIKNGIVVDISFKGYPRMNGDGWIHYYKSKKVGDTVTDNLITITKEYNGNYNVISKFEEEEL